MRPKSFLLKKNIVITKSSLKKTSLFAAIQSWIVSEKNFFACGTIAIIVARNRSEEA